MNKRKLHFTHEGEKAICTSYDQGMQYDLEYDANKVTCKRCIKMINKGLVYVDE